MTEYFSVSIPQAVGTVATIILYLLDEFRNSVSIPQAVSTVATHISYSREGSRIVSIPQAVSTVATLIDTKDVNEINVFQYRKR